MDGGSSPVIEKQESGERWSRKAVLELFNRPFNDLLFEAQSVHRQHFLANEVQLSTLLNIKTGGCPEDCGYCSQSAHHESGLKAEKLMDVDDVLTAARAAKDAGATRFCMGAAWRSPKDRDLDKVIPMIEGVHDLGLESCVTLGMVTPDQAARLRDAGLDYYNHNVDTSEEYYGVIVTTRSYGDRIETLGNLRQAGVKLCSGGIVGMGEARTDRAEMLRTLGNLPQPPESVPINMLVPIAGTPLQDVERLDALELIRTVAVARIMMPTSYVRLSAGRREMSEEGQAMCFFAGANSIFYGDTLLTTENPDIVADQALFRKLGITGQPGRVEGKAAAF